MARIPPRSRGAVGVVQLLPHRPLTLPQILHLSRERAVDASVTAARAPARASASCTAPPRTCSATSKAANAVVGGDDLRSDLLAIVASKAT